MTITINVTDVTGQINVPIHVTPEVISANPIKNINWRCNRDVNFSISLDNKTLNFTPSYDGVFVFTVSVTDDKDEFIAKTITITVGIGDTAPTLDTTPSTIPSGTVIYDSNVDGKWNDGVKRTITTAQNGQQPNDKSIFVAASGNPQLVIDGDGTAHLVAGSGGVDNISLRLRSLHQAGGECEHRFGGFGFSIARSDIDMKTEVCHNIHENAIGGTHGIDIDNGQWHSTRFECKDVGSSVEFNTWIDGKFIKKGTHNSPKPYYLDKARLENEGMIWIRLNNTAHGRIYICVGNYNALLELDFKFEPAQNSIALRNVKVYSL